MIGQYFLDKCIDTPVEADPWQHQILTDSLPQDSFNKLKKSCDQFIKKPVDKLIHIHPGQFKEHKIEWYDEIHDLGRVILSNAKKLCERYNNHRWFPEISLNGHISITPPLPYKFHIHMEGVAKFWSSVTYITPDKNIGTKMYRKEEPSSFVKEAHWKPNNTFIFCGKRNETWHSYESGESTNRITLNFFLMKDDPRNYLRSEKKI